MMGYKPYYNPYLLEVDHERQRHYFLQTFERHKVPCILLNTGVEGVEQTQGSMEIVLNTR